MKNFLKISLIALIGILLFFRFVYYGDLLEFYTNDQLSTFATNVDKDLYVKVDGAYEVFEMRGVNVGSGVPGYYADELAITKSDYLRWFKAIQDMGANTVRVYTILNNDFYNAVYEYNYKNDNPLYIVHGLWLDDYNHFSHRDMFDKDLLGALEQDAKGLVDFIHGVNKIEYTRSNGFSYYHKDISPWVVGYILGVEWDDFTMAYTNHKYEDYKTAYKGEYMYTYDGATPFEMAMAQLGDTLISYESKRYGQQRLVAFSNWPKTDPFEYNAVIEEVFGKPTAFNIENIKTTENFISGTFASYHIYPYFPDYLAYDEDVSIHTDKEGKINTYYAYLKQIADYHTVPVIISEFGIPSGRGMSHRDIYTGRDQGFMSEKDQAEALVACYEDIINAGCKGGIVFSWQDEWFKKTWNVFPNIDFQNTPYWSDYQNNEQSFGLLAFDLGKDESIAYVDGEISEWTDVEAIADDGKTSLKAMYDEKYMYFLVENEDLKPEDTVYLPLDITPKTGASYSKNYDLSFDRDVDFIIKIGGQGPSRMLVQKRYEVLRATFGDIVYNENPYEMPPEKDTEEFVPIHLLLSFYEYDDFDKVENREDFDLRGFKRNVDLKETGQLMEGNGNPKSEDFNSLADYCYGQGNLEIRIPWQLMNFHYPNKMMIHDDYYEHYGVESFKINKMYLGVALNPVEASTIPMRMMTLRGWSNTVTYHERFKESYYALKELWTKGE